MRQIREVSRESLSFHVCLNGLDEGLGSHTLGISCQYAIYFMDLVYEMFHDTVKLS